MEEYGYTNEDIKESFDCMLSYYLMDNDELWDNHVVLDSEHSVNKTYGYNESELKSFIKKEGA
jgi:GTP-binding protein EngB required for normal cell division